MAGLLEICCRPEKALKRQCERRCRLFLLLFFPSAAFVAWDVHPLDEALHTPLQCLDIQSFFINSAVGCEGSFYQCCDLREMIFACGLTHSSSHRIKVQIIGFS